MVGTIKAYEKRIGLLWRTVEQLRLEILSNHRIIERLTARCNALSQRLKMRDRQRPGDGSGDLLFLDSFDLESLIPDEEHSHLWN